MFQNLHIKQKSDELDQGLHASLSISALEVVVAEVEPLDDVVAVLEHALREAAHAVIQPRAPQLEYVHKEHDRIIFHLLLFCKTHGVDELVGADEADDDGGEAEEEEERLQARRDAGSRAPGSKDE